MRTFQQIGTDTGAPVEAKNRAYGSSFETVGAAMRLLYPRGISPGQMNDALLLTRIWDKMMRIATDRDALGESPYGDIAGYGILGVHMHQGAAMQQQQEKDPSCPGSASGPDVPNPPKAHPVSATQSTSAKTTPNAAASSASASSPKANDSSASTSAPGSILTVSAPVPTATAGASGSADVLAEAVRANARGVCGFCKVGWVMRVSTGRPRVWVCDETCAKGYQLLQEVR